MRTTYEYAESLLDKIDPLPKGPDGQPTKRIVYGNFQLMLFFFFDLLVLILIFTK